RRCGGESLAQDRGPVPGRFRGRRVHPWRPGAALQIPGLAPEPLRVPPLWQPGCAVGLVDAGPFDDRDIRRRLWPGVGPDPAARRVQHLASPARLWQVSTDALSVLAA